MAVDATPGEASRDIRKPEMETNWKTANEQAVMYMYIWVDTSIQPTLNVNLIRESSGLFKAGPLSAVDTHVTIQ